MGVSGTLGDQSPGDEVPKVWTSTGNSNRGPRSAVTNNLSWEGDRGDEFVAEVAIQRNFGYFCENEVGVRMSRRSGKGRRLTYGMAGIHEKHRWPRAIPP